ncbi:MAG: hypothetical protein E7Z92_02420 [Cyanobacteria bacterium SIG31]|nr:hypothetical protein [Cyanobacteria bacterium SIG31]
MKVFAISSYNHKTRSFKYSQEPSFEGKLQLKETANKVITKKNLFNFALLSFLITKLIDLSEFEIPDIIKELPIYIMAGAFCVTDNQVKLEENIEFKKAETIEEARKFAEEKLGIKKFKINDLEYANWINEGLTNISNRFKGEVYFPQKIKFHSYDRKNALADYVVIADTIRINKKRIEERVSDLDNLLKENSYEELTKYNLGKGYDDFCKKLTKAYNSPESLTFFEKYSLVGSIYKVKERLKQLDNKKPSEINTNGINLYGNIYQNEFETIYHEVGHCFDFKSKTLIDICTDRIKSQKDLKHLVLPRYHKKNTFEFVASIFAGIMQGEKYPDDVMNLYKKLIKFKMPV